MKKKPATKRTVVAKTKRDGLAPLIAEVRNLIQSARGGVASVVDTFQVMTNFEIGRRIVEHEQKGEKRAAYGTELLKELSARLTEEFGRGFSKSNLAAMRGFYLLWAGRVQIIQKPSGKLPAGEIFQSPSEKLDSSKIVQKPSAKFTNPFTLSWSHYVELLTVKDPDERSFYEIEATNSGWSLPELRRQKAAALYHRLALSRDKAGVKRLAEKGQLITKPEDTLKNPYVLEFLGLDEKSGYSESDLESAIITHLEKFLLELGKGFLFEARQKRFTFDGDHYFLDLVFSPRPAAACGEGQISYRFSPSPRRGERGSGGEGLGRIINLCGSNFPSVPQAAYSTVEQMPALVLELAWPIPAWGATQGCGARQDSRAEGPAYRAHRRYSKPGSRPASAEFAAAATGEAPA